LLIRRGVVEKLQGAFITGEKKCQAKIGEIECSEEVVRWLVVAAGIFFKNL
jgi:hypothetical protein